MIKKVMIIAVLAIITMGGGLAVPLSAQAYGTDSFSLASNTSDATAGLFKNDVDNYMNYHKYSGILKDSKWFSFVSGKTDKGGVLDAGYARNIGKIYLGVWYRGNILRTAGDDPESTTTVTPVWNDTLEILEQRKDKTEYKAKWYDSANKFEFLIGVANQGIKVGFYESVRTNKNEGSTSRNVTVVDYLDGRKDYTNAVDEYVNTQSWLKPYVGWGSVFKVSNMSLSPYADLSLLMVDDKLIDKYSSYTTVNGEKQNVKKSIGVGHSNGYMTPSAKIGAKLDLEKKGSVQTQVELSYAIEADLYGNDAAGLGNVSGTVKNIADGYANRETKYSDRTLTETDITYSIDEKSKMKHTITPIYKVTGEPAENLKVGFQANLPITITSESSKQYSKHVERESYKYNTGLPGYVHEKITTTYTGGGKSETSDLNVKLNLNLGATYQLIPERFGINAGIAATPVNYTTNVKRTKANTVDTITTEKTTQDDKSVTQNEKTVTLQTENDVVVETVTWAGYTATLRGGFTFNFNNNAALDLGLSSDANSFKIDLATVNVIVTVKY